MNRRRFLAMLGIRPAAPVVDPSPTYVIRLWDEPTGYWVEDKTPEEREELDRKFAEYLPAIRRLLGPNPPPAVQKVIADFEARTTAKDTPSTK